MGRRWGLAAVLLAALGARAAVVGPRWGRPVEDPDNYLAIAGSVAGGEGYRLHGRLTAYRPPLYPLVLAPLVGAFGAAPWAVYGLNVGLGVATVGLTARAARRWGRAEGRVLLAAGIVALDPVLVAQARWAMTETLAAFLGAVVMLGLAGRGRLACRGWGDSRGDRLRPPSQGVGGDELGGRGGWRTPLPSPPPQGGRRSEGSAAGRWFRWWGGVEVGEVRGALIGGAALGVASLCRPSSLPVAIAVAGAGLVAPPGGWRGRAVRAVLVLGATFGVLAPWAARNARVFGEAVWTTTHGGYTLALGNNKFYYDDVFQGAPGAAWSGPGQDAWWAGLNRRTWGRPEPEADRIIRAEALGTIRDRPGDFLRASAARVGRFWGLAPSAGVYPRALRVATALWTAPLWGLLAAGLLRRDAWRWPRVAAPAMLAALTAVHSAYWTDLRMRAPLVPAIALVASGAGGARRRAATSAGAAARGPRCSPDRSC